MMEEVIINCRTGEETRRQLTAAEVDIRKAEITEAVLESENQEREQAKAQLIEAGNRLEQAAALVVEGVLDADDVQPIQERVDELRRQLKPIGPKPIEK